MGLTQKQMAQKCGLPYRTYQDREAGRAPIKIDF